MKCWLILKPGQTTVELLYMEVSTFCVWLLTAVSCYPGSSCPTSCVSSSRRSSKIHSGVFWKIRSQVMQLHQIRAELEHGQLNPGRWLLSWSVWISQIYRWGVLWNKLLYDLVRGENKNNLQGLSPLYPH